jgi:hypothetical protein
MDIILLNRRQPMKISECHKAFERYNSVGQGSFETPELSLGHNYLTLLNFWLYLDTLDTKQWRMVVARYAPFLGSNISEHESYWSKYTYIPDHFWNCAFNSKLDESSVRLAVEFASYEIYIMDAILNDGKQLIYVPLFDNL